MMAVVSKYYHSAVGFRLRPARRVRLLSERVHTRARTQRREYVPVVRRGGRKVTRQESIAYRQVKRSARIQTLVGVVILAGSLAAETDNSSSSRQRRVNRNLQYLGISEGLNRVVGGIQRGREADAHVAAIGELSESFGAQAAPMVVNVEGQERRLTGTAQAQYDGWRRLLREIYQAETGFTKSVDVGVPARATENTVN